MNRITMFEGYGSASRTAPSAAQAASRKRFGKCAKTCTPKGSKGFRTCMRTCLRPAGSKPTKRSTKRRRSSR